MLKLVEAGKQAVQAEMRMSELLLASRRREVYSARGKKVAET